MFKNGFAGTPTMDQRPFKVLVIGDSLIWGQGLLEGDKTYTHVTEWLRREHFAGRQSVDLKVKAHSGATITVEAKPGTKQVRVVGDEDRAFTGEVNLSYPSMWKQVELAAAEYRSAGHARGADLVLLTAGITDLTVEGVLDPFEDSRKLIPRVEEVCRDRVSRLLEYTLEHNPDALVAVVGYFPIISPHSSRKRVFNGWLDVLSVPGPAQPLINNPMIRALFFRRLFKNAVKRSRVWREESDRNLRFAVKAANTKRGGRSAVFIASPLTEEHAAESTKTMLFRMQNDGRSEDPLYAARTAQCKAVFKELERTTGEKHSARRCSIAGVGHPNPSGARLYADAIISELKNFLPARSPSGTER